MVSKQDGQRKGAVQPGYDGLDGFNRVQSIVQCGGNQVHDGFRICVGSPLDPARAQFFAQRVEVLDDTVVDDRDFAVGMGVSIGDVWDTVGGPTGVADATASRQRRPSDFGGQVLELALSAATLDLTIDQGRDPGAVIAPVFEAFQAINQLIGYAISAKDSNDSTHKVLSLFLRVQARFDRS